MELLAPAKNTTIGIAAINAGADAVYIGASDFGARKAASNSINDIDLLCKHAHLYGAKVFVTINTILYDNEIKHVENLIHQLYNIGVDALIIQDMGILEMNIPNIELHASTQMHNYNIKRIKFLDDIGFRRIVLARECSISQIKEIKQSIKAQIECFVHGALCVSFSGQCYMSAQLGGRSANRGECAQACRMKYSLLTNEGKTLINDSYILSLKDFATYNKISNMIDAGVDSFKIEGRLKDISYVSSVTAYYRKMIDSIAGDKAKNSSGICFYDYEPSITKVFNRGFTEYFLNSKTEKMANFVSPKSIGEPIGTITANNGNIYTIDTKESLANGDGLCYVHNGELFGFRIEKKLSESQFAANHDKNLKPGTKIMRNLDSTYIKKLEHSKTMRKIRITQHLIPLPNELTLSTTDEDGISTSTSIQYSSQPADKPDMALQNLKNSLSKTGECFVVESFTIEKDAIIPFVPNSIINELRRKSLEIHSETRIKHFVPTGYPIPSGDVEYFEESGDYKLNVANKLAKTFYEKHGCKISQPAFELLTNTKGLEVMTTKYCIRRESGYCIKECKKIPLEWKSDKFVLKGAYQDFVVSIDCSRCVMHIISTCNHKH